MARWLWLMLLFAVASAPMLPVGTARAAPAAEDPGQAAYEALSEQDRRAVQDALTWTGDYVGVVTGGYGPRTRDALAAYADKHHLAPAALMGAAPRKALLNEAQALKQAVGFATVKDKKTAFTLSLPTKLLGKETPTATGTRYSSPDSTIVVDTLSRAAGDAGLSDTFTRMSAPQPQRKITYKLLRDDFFVVTGEVGDRKFYSRYALGVAGEASLVRGFTLTYPQAAASRLDPIALAIAASLDAFPGPRPPAAPGPTASSTAPAPPAAQPPPGIDAQALMVAPGLALTSVTSQTCQNPQVDKAAAKFRSEDTEHGLALLEVSGRTGSAPVLSPDNADAHVVVLFAGRSGVTFAAPGLMRQPGPGEFTLNAPLQSAGRGAPVFDSAGRLLGVAGLAKSPPAIAGTILQADYRATGVVPIGKLLDAAGVPRASGTSEPLSFGAIVAARKAQLAAVTCGRA